MLKGLTLRGSTVRGTTGAINWGYRPVVALTSWTVSHTREVGDGPGGTLTLKPSAAGWTLTATLGPVVDRFQLRQRPLLFTAPRKGGFWCWPVHQLTVGETTLVATLGPPEY